MTPSSLFKFLLPLLFTALPLFAQEEPIIWQAEFRFDHLPSEVTKEWRTQRPAASSIVEGRLVLDPGELSHAYWFLNHRNTLSKWDGSHATTVEFRMRVRNEATQSALIMVSDGDKSYLFNLSAQTMTTYRLVLDQGEATLYRIDSPDPVHHTTGKENHGEPRGSSPIGANSIAFGKIRKTNQGISEWEFIRWTHEGAFPPMASRKLSPYPMAFIPPLQP